MTLAVGDPAPDFILDGIDGATGEPGRFSLAEQRGHPTILAFYPADRSPVCVRQLRSYTEQFARLSELGAGVLAISPQDLESHRAFARDQGGFAFPLLTDPDCRVARSYGNLGLLNLYRRCLYVVDGGGIVRWAHRSIGPGLTFEPVDRLVEVVASVAGVSD